MRNPSTRSRAIDKGATMVDSPHGNCVSTCQSGTSDGSVLLDVGQDRMFKLNPTAAEMWKLISAGETAPQIIKTIAGQYGVSEHQVSQDVSALMQRIAALGLKPERHSITGSSEENGDRRFHPSFPWYGQDPEGSQPKPKMKVVAEAVLGLFGFDIILSLFSFQALCSCVRRWPIIPRRSPDSAAIGGICSAVERACVWYPRAALCLQRSAVTTCLLRSHGFAAKLVIGARPMPLLAHAWVEIDGSVVNDWPKVKEFYHRILSQQ